MRTEVVMPQMGESVAEGTVTVWLKQIGDHVDRDEPLFEITTDKVDAEVPSPVAGILREQLVEPGTTVEINTIVAIIDTHVAHPEQPSHGCSDVVRFSSRGHEYSGRVFGEYPSEISSSEKEGLLWAAYSDAQVFWPFEPDLVAMLKHAGFERVQKIDPLDPTIGVPWNVDKVNRVVYAGWV